MSVYAPLAAACLPRLAGGCLPKRISRKSRNALFRHPEEARSFCLLARAKTSASLRASTLCFCKAQTSRVGAHKRPASPKTEPRAAWRSRRISCVRICVSPRLRDSSATLGMTAEKGTSREPCRGFPFPERVASLRSRVPENRRAQPEIFGKRRSGAHERALPLWGYARVRPTAPTRALAKSVIFARASDFYKNILSAASRKIAGACAGIFGRKRKSRAPAGGRKPAGNAKIFIHHGNQRRKPPCRYKK